MTVSKLNKKRPKWLIPLAVIAVVICIAYVLFVFYAAYQLSQGPEIEKKAKEYVLIDCSKRPEGYLRNDCFATAAKFYKDPSICVNLSSTRSREGCYSVVAEAAKNLSMCDLIIDDNNTREYCYQDIIIALGNPELCEKINIISIRDNCYNGLAGAAGDPALCDKIVNSHAEKVTCIEDIAISKEDAVICYKLEEGDKENCLIRLAEKTKNPSFCERIENPARDECYQIMSWELKDKSLCSKIEGKHNRLICES